MRSIDVSRNIAARRSAVWAVLADFPNIAGWNGGVKTSFSTSDSNAGVGAKRHCDLSPFGGLEETVAEWQPEEKMVIAIDSASKLPLKRGSATFILDEVGETTTTRVHYEYQPRFGPVASLIGPRLDRQFVKGFNGFLEDLENAARAGASASAE